MGRLFRLGVLLVVLLVVTGVKASLLDSVAGGWSFGFTGFVPPRGCELYVGGHNPGVVYRYNGSGWEPISPVLGYAVMDMVVYNGRLYAAVTTGYGGYSGVGRVYMYNGGKSWSLVGDGLDRGVLSLAVYNGELYAGTGRGAFRVYKYTPGSSNVGIMNWTRVVDYPWDGARELFVSRGFLLIGDSLYDRIGRWDGRRFYADMDAGGSCIYDFAEFGEYVYAAAYAGVLYRSRDGIRWEWVLGYYGGGNMWSLAVYRGRLFMGYNNGELRAWNGTGDPRGVLVFRAPDAILSMATDGVYLYFGTGGDAVGFGARSWGIANVYVYDGKNVFLISRWDEFGAGVQKILVVCPFLRASK
jgi:hypothetical protein